MLPLRAEIRTDTPIVDARSAARRTLRLEVSANPSDDAATALIHNLSETGLLLETAAQLQIGELLQVDLPHAGTTTALVVWSRGSFIGCEFASPISKASVSAALLKSPAEREQPLARAVGSGETIDNDPVDWEQTLAARSVLFASLLVALLTAALFILALLRAPFSTF